MSATPRAVDVAAAWLPAALYMALIWALSSMGRPPVPVERFPFRDKGVHLIEYAVLAALLCHAVVRTWRGRSSARLAAFSVLATLAWGVLDELHQAFVPGRSADLLDLVADAAGATTGTLARILMHRRAASPAVDPVRTE